MYMYLDILGIYYQYSSFQHGGGFTDILLDYIILKNGHAWNNHSSVS